MSAAKEGLPVTPALVQWARERAGFSLEDAQLKFKKIAQWETGEAMPSYTQIEEMAERFKIPVAVFFFPSPPKLPPVERSFRTLGPEEFASIPRSVRMVLRQAQAMQINLAELHEGKNPAPSLVVRDLKVSQNAPLDKIAQQVRAYLGVSLQEQVAWPNVEKALEGWREVFLRKAGVYVFKEPFRAKKHFGFCLYDDEFPVIYINNSSAKSRQIFTLFHELGHLLFRTSGIDRAEEPFLSHSGESEQKIEAICNSLAAKVLVPDEALEPLLRGVPANRQTADQLANRFKVSREMIYRKLLDRGLIDKQEYLEAAALWASQAGKRDDDEGGGNYYNNLHAYLGQRYVDLAFTRYHQQRFDARQLAQYLNMKPKSLPMFAQRFGGGGL